MLFIMIMLVLFRFIPVEPYAAHGLGDLEDTSKIVQIKELHIQDRGAHLEPFYYTTVRTRYFDNLLEKMYSYSLKHRTEERVNLPTKNGHVPLETFPGLSAEDDLQYSISLKWDSVNNITSIALKYAGYTSAFHEKVEITNVFDNFEAAKFLKLHDEILSFNHQSINSVEDVVNAPKNVKLGDTVPITINREGKKVEFALTYAQTDESGKPIIGFQSGIMRYYDDFDINKLVAFPESLSGDSAGMMISLQLIQSITGEDLTKGYKIGGTGTINADETIGEIGSMPLKIRTAVEDKADIYLVPKSSNNDEQNEFEALKTKVEIKTDLKIVPVENLQEALEFLRSLSPK